MSYYRVDWQVKKTVNAKCPDYKPDPYTGNYPHTQCSVSHTKEVTERRKRYFRTKEKAVAFMEAAPDIATDWTLTLTHSIPHHASRVWFDEEDFPPGSMIRTDEFTP